MALAVMAAELSPSPTTICTFGVPGMAARILRWFSSSKHRPRSGRVRYSSLLRHRVCTSTMPFWAAKSSLTWEKTASWAAA